MIITIFGSGSPAGEGILEAEELGRRIAISGHTVKNGGYAGTMKASARGASNVGGHVIGVCIEGHSIADEKKPNEFVKEVILVKSLHERVGELMNADVIVVLRGQVGTLAELFAAWADNAFLVAKNEKPKPIYVVGKENRKLVNFLVENDYVAKKYMSLISLVDSIDALPFLKPKTDGKVNK